VRLLLDHRAALDARDDESGATPLYVAAAMGRSDVVKLLVEKGADVNLATRAGATPLHAALSNEFDEVAALLRAHGAR